MKHLILSFLSLLLFIQSTAALSVELQSNQYKFKFESEETRFSGQYRSYYKNGELRAEGSILNGYRIGKWLIYDSIGTLLATRDFNDFGSVMINNKKKGFNTKINENDYASYDSVQPADVLFSKRIWRLIPRVYNDNLFKFKWSAILSNWFKNKSTAFYIGPSDEFTTAITDKQISKILKFECDEIRIKEDYFYDKKREIGEYRIVAIGFDFYIGSEIPETIWLYFPEVRALLAKISTNEVSSIEHLLFVRDFYSFIYKETNSRNSELSTYTDASTVEDERYLIQFNLLEAEHDIWLN